MGMAGVAGFTEAAIEEMRGCDSEAAANDDDNSPEPADSPLLHDSSQSQKGKPSAQDGECTA